MGLVINGISIENIKVVDSKTQEETFLDVLQNQHGVIIWNKDSEFIPESLGSVGLIYTGLDVNGYMETEEGFDGTIVGYMLGDGSKNACNGLDLNMFDLNATSIVVPSEHNGLPVIKVGQFSLVPISAVNNAGIFGGVYFENQIIMPNLTEIKLGANLKEFDKSFGRDGFSIFRSSSICIDYSLNCRVNIPSTVEVLKYPEDDFAVKSSTIYDNRTIAEGSYEAADGLGNISCKTIIFGKNVETVGVFYDTSGSNYKIIAGFVEVEFEERTKPISLSEYSFAQQANLVRINLPNTLSVLPMNCFRSCTALTQITIPKSVSSIGDLCFYETSGLTSVRFEHSNSDSITLPTAGNSTGMLYVKTAKTMTVYTDNETIKNYNFAADNITATILHLDGSAW